MKETVFSDSFKEARNSLINTQIRGKKAEDAVEFFLSSEKISYLKRKKDNYLDIPRADVEVDFRIEMINGFETHISVTHSNPKIPGHSNENKLHQKISELYLFKTKKPETRIILVVGGDKAKWSPYVLEVFKIFFDKVVFADNKNFVKEMKVALDCSLKNKKFWENEKKLIKNTKFLDDKFNICKRNIRQEFFVKVISSLSEKTPPQYPNQITNSILRKMSEAGTQTTFFSYLKRGEYSKIWQERNYFNVLEALTELILEERNIWFKGGLGKSVSVHHSVLHDLGFKTTRFTEDFLIYSKRYKKRVYIQCKSSSGGPNDTSKALPSRAREQIGRSILYRTTLDKNNKLVSNRKDYIMIFVVDGKWNFPKEYPLKYIHILQIAGADLIINGCDLVDDNFEIKKGNKLEKILKDLDCTKNPKN